MAVKIRLKRMGAKKRPFYRVVVADARSPRDGRFIESVGYYDPLHDPAVVKLDDQRIRHWMGTGAKPSDVVRELMERQGLLPASARPARAKAAQPEVAAAPGESAASPASPAANAAVDAEAPEAMDEPAEAPAEDASQTVVSEPEGGVPEAADDDDPAFPAEPGEA
ncbi:MAG: 30S ribosomal protein S16 [Candidatus Dormibacteraeota bacterium]|nr:30S ribosomal protein S16 [Candidatus Dormibacteraeota bacterium]